MGVQYNLYIAPPNKKMKKWDEKKYTSNIF